MDLAAKAKLIRSKNAGPFQLTFDVMFSDSAGYQEVVKAEVITPEVVARLYKCAVSDVAIYHCANARAIKVTIPRPRVQGSFGDPDLHGGQQHVPMMTLQVPGPAAGPDALARAGISASGQNAPAPASDDPVATSR